MVYVALLRGINVGGNSIVPMAELKSVFEDAGLERVRTYINSGNVIFSARSASKAALVSSLEARLERRFGKPITLVLRTLAEMQALVEAIPTAWVNDAGMRCDVMFLWKGVDRPGVVNELPVTADIEDVRYLKGAVVWRIDRALVARTKMSKIIGTPVYKQMTARNINTVRKLCTLMESV